MPELSERWGALRDREALDEPLTQAERAEADRIETHDASAAAEAAVWRQLEGMLDAPADALGLNEADHRLVAAVMEKVEGIAAPARPDTGAADFDLDLDGALAAELTGPRPVAAIGRNSANDFGDGPDWIGRSSWALSGVLAAAAAVALVYWEPATSGTPSAESDDPIARTAPVDRSVPTATPAVVTPTVVRLSEARVAGRGGPVLRDGAALEVGAPLHEGDVLTMQNAGCVEVEPAVEFCAAAGSVVRVGSLALESRSLELEKGRAVASLEPQPEGASFSIVAGPVRARATGTVYSVERGTEHTRVRVLEGTVQVSAGDKSVSVQTGTAVVWSAASGMGPAGLTPRDQQRDLSLAETGRERRVRAQPVGPPPVGELMGRAWELLKAKQYAAAASAFERVRRLHPGSRESHVVLVRLGDLRLDRLGDPAGALTSYQSYLDSGAGPLAAEARLGRIRALRKLGQTNAERKAIEDYLGHHPRSFKVPTLRKRLAELGDAR